uniref:Uncharacterized protein n=1 Tax=Glossina austeni TaxID=7395 RepID=A0A1A9UIP1_GLOAU
MEKAARFHTYKLPGMKIRKTQLQCFGGRKLQKVENSLQDSLVCSGCITCAEGVLITQLCPAELLKVLNENLRPMKNSQIKSA